MNLSPKIDVRPSPTGWSKYTATIPASLWNRHHDDKVVRQKTVQFGDKRYQQYKDQFGFWSTMDHYNHERRKNYRKRHRGILAKDGTPAYKKKYSPAWFSYYYLW